MSFKKAAAAFTQPAAVFLALTLIPIPSALADKAGASDPDRFNNVDTWYGDVRLTVSTDFKPEAIDCSNVRHDREEVMEARVYLHLPVSESLPEEDGSGDGHLRGFWGGPNYSGQELVTGTVTRHIKEVETSNCESTRMDIRTEGSDRSKGGNAMLMIMPAMTQMISGGDRLYGFNFSSEPLKAKETGSRGYRISQSPDVWRDDPVDRDVTENFYTEAAPWKDETTVDMDEEAARMQEGSKRMLDNLPQMTGMLSPKLIGEIQKGLSESEEDASEAPDDYEDPFEPAWIRVPDSGMVLSGQLHKIIDNENERTEVTLQWMFHPDQELHYDLEIEIENYKSWMPKGDRDPDKAGSNVVIHARLVEPGTGKPANVRAKKIIFELLDDNGKKTSREKGTAMNYPLDSTDMRPDLRFEKSANPDGRYEVKKGGLIIEDAGGDISESKVTLSSFDWGAVGLLKAEAVLEGPAGAEKRVQGYFKDDPSKTEIELPKRGPSSWIADQWKQDNAAAGKPDSSDEDDQPKGDGHAGDGLTLYEEYRGFYVLDPKTKKPVHVRGDPKKKELFVMNLIDTLADAGIDLFQKESEILVHRVDETMMHKDRRVINANHTAGKHAVDQHGLVIIEDADVDSPVARGTTPGNPQFCDRIIMPPSSHKGWIRDYIYRGKKMVQDTYASSLAHEMMHCVSVVHHGEGDVWWVEWEFAKDEDGMRVLHEWKNGVGNGTPTVIFPFFEGKGSAMIDVYNRRVKANAPLKVFVGKWGGEHSGYERCMMRYDRARAYIREGRPANFRYVIYPESEWSGSELCGKKEDEPGGVNHKDRSPWPRYGPAAEGNCKAQLCVSDVYGHKDR